MIYCTIYAYLQTTQNRNAANMVRKLNQELMDEIINELSHGDKTGYEIYKELKRKGLKVSSRLVYHYLYVALKNDRVKMETKNEIGNFSWGTTTRKKYYKLK